MTDWHLIAIVAAALCDYENYPPEPGRYARWSEKAVNPGPHADECKVFVNRWHRQARAVLAAVRPAIEARERAIFAKWHDDSHMQLHAGEMKAQERRSVKAVLDCVEHELTAIRAQQAHDEPQEKPDNG